MASKKEKAPPPTSDNEPAQDPNILTVSEFERLSEEEKQRFRDAGGTVTN